MDKARKDMLMSLARQGDEKVLSVEPKNYSLDVAFDSEEFLESLEQFCENGTNQNK